VEINRFRPKLGHDLREIHTNATRDHELKDAGLAHRLERRQRDGHLGLVVVVGVLVRVRAVELAGQLLVRVRLDRQGLARAQDLEEPRQLPAGRLDDLRELRPVVHEAWPARVRPQPELRVYGGTTGGQIKSNSNHIKRGFSNQTKFKQHRIKSISNQIC